ncbi:Fe-S cluster assembly protein SufD [Rhabdaerophilum calidifontis]|uniref:Fe-S cluster assembly protein SufD n=1 Tax=Rhabdaerophilum calidifontis TaxID=2604328 RepID=UPI00319EAF01
MNATILPIRTPAETALAERFATERARLPGAAAVRAAAFARFEKTGLPSRRVESWHYTDLRSLMRELAPAAGEAAVPAALPEFEGLGHRLVLVNGRAGAGPLPAGVTVEPLATALAAGRVALGAAMGAAEDTIVDLNTALAREGLAIRIARGAEAALHLAFVTVAETAVSVASRIVVEVEPGAALTLVETHTGPDGLACQQNIVVELALGAGARVEHVRVNESGDAALALSTLAATLAAGSALASLNVSTGGAVSRHQVFVTYAGEGATLSLRGATMIKGRQHCDNTLVVDHAVPHGESRELFRTVIDDEAQGVFQGKIIVRPDAQKTDGQMASNALLLGDEAGMANKPELEIFADDVVCAHGATCGALDENQLFYLMARGLPKPEAEALLVEAFVAEALDQVRHEGIRAALTAKIGAFMRGRAR